MFDESKLSKYRNSFAHLSKWFLSKTTITSTRLMTSTVQWCIKSSPSGVMKNIPFTFSISKIISFNCFKLILLPVFTSGKINYGKTNCESENKTVKNNPNVLSHSQRARLHEPSLFKHSIHLIPVTASSLAANLYPFVTAHFSSP